MRKINVERYPEKWKELNEKYEHEEAVELYYKFSRSFSLEKYIHKYGKEEGKKLYNEKRDKRKFGVRLEDLIKKYGVKEGNKRYDNWRKSVAGTKKNFIIRHGDEGEKKFDEFKKKCVVKHEIKNEPNSKYNNRSFNNKLQFYLDKGLSLEEAKKELSERQKTTKLESLIKKYGEEIGKEKYLEYNKNRINSLENFVERYGEIDGVERFEKYKETLKLVRSKESLIEKHGLEWYNDYVIRKTNNFKKIKYSQISFFLFEKLILEFGDKFKKVYYGDNEYVFYFRDKEFSLIRPDFYIKDINYCVEFYGDFWHKNPNIEKYKDLKYDTIREKDKRRIKIIKKEFGTDVDIVWECDYRNNPEKVISEIINNIKNKTNEYRS